MANRDLTAFRDRLAAWSLRALCFAPCFDAGAARVIDVVGAGVLNDPANLMVR